MRTLASIAAPIESPAATIARYAASARVVSPAATQARPASDRNCPRKNGNRAASAGRALRGAGCPEIPNEQHGAYGDDDSEIGRRLPVPPCPLDQARREVRVCWGRGTSRSGHRCRHATRLLKRRSFDVVCLTPLRDVLCYAFRVLRPWGDSNTRPTV